MSGGERSLTALALLFAIFTARPSPFYVMDEVEAALDDVNLTRLINAFNELRAHAQLIIITHQQRTMSIADARGEPKTRTINEWFLLTGTGATGDRGWSISKDHPQFRFARQLPPAGAGWY